jgi:hypothetical protein
MSYSIKITIWITALLFAAQFTFAQKVDPAEFGIYKQKYPEEQAVFLKYYEELDVKIVGDSLVVTSTNYKEMLHLGNQSNVYAKDGIHSSEFYQTLSIEAKTLVPDKKKFKTVMVTEFKETFDKNSSVFYDDTKYLNFIYPAIQPGVHTILEYTQRIKNPKFLGTFLFQNYLPIVHSKYTITVDNEIALKMKVINDLSGLITKKTELINGRTRYTFECENAEKLSFEKDAPPIRFSAPHLAVIIEKFKANGVDHNVLSSPKDLFSWYSTFIKDLKKVDYDNIKEVVNSIISADDTEKEKVRKIFYWVQNNIKYIAFEDGMRGLIPHNAAYVCDKRYGDCKDMASITVNMLNAAGIEAYFTWIGTRDIPYKYSELPSPIVDNHMIATYIDSEDYYFLDATSQYSAYNLPSSMTQGKEALIALDENNFEIREVPILAKEQNVTKDSAHFKLVNGNISGSGKLSLKGYPKVFNSYKMIKSSSKAVDDYITKLLGRGSNKFFVENYKIDHLDNLDKPIEVVYDFRIEDYYRKIGNKIYFNMNLDKSFTGDIIEDNRKQAKENDFKYINESISVLEVPENYKVKHLPENATFSNDVFGFDITYTVIDDQVILKRQFFVDYLLLEKDKFEQWNEVIKKLSNAYRDALILENEGA